VESKNAERKGAVMKETILANLFWIGLTLCGCGVENIFGTREQQVTYIAIFVLTIVAAFGLGRGE